MRDWILDLFIKQDKSLPGSKATDLPPNAPQDPDEQAIWIFRPPWPGRSDPGIQEKEREVLRTRGRPMALGFPLDWYLYVVRHHYFDFNGRARRRQYLFFLGGFCVLMVLGAIVEALLFSDPERFPVMSAILLLSLAPGLGVAVRRLHDIDKSGWWLLIGVIPVLGIFMLLFWALCAGDRGPNAYGDPPG